MPAGEHVHRAGVAWQGARGARGAEEGYAIAVRNVSGRRRRSKLKEWLTPPPTLAEGSMA